MNRRWIIALSLIFAAVLAGITLGVFRQQVQASQRKSVRAWAMDLNSPDAQTRTNAEATIKAAGSKSVPQLIRLLNVRDSRIRSSAIRVGVKLPWPFKQAALRWFGGPPASMVRWSAAHALAVIGPQAKDAIPALNAALHDPDGAVCWGASEALSRIGRESVPALAADLQDKNKQVRHAAVYALGLIGPAAAAERPKILQAMNDSDENVRWAAVIAYQRIDPDYLAVFLSIIENDKTLRREAVVKLVPRFYPPPSDIFPSLIKMARDDQPAARRQAIETLGVIQPWDEAVLATMVAALDDPAMEVRTAATNVLAAAGQRQRYALPALTKARASESPAVRVWADKIIGEINRNPVASP